MMLGLIKRNFKHLTIPTFILLYNSMVRSHLDYCSSVWAPYRKGDIEILETVKIELRDFFPVVTFSTVQLVTLTVTAGHRYDLLNSAVMHTETTGHQTRDGTRSLGHQFRPGWVSVSQFTVNPLIFTFWSIKLF